MLTRVAITRHHREHYLESTEATGQASFAGTAQEHAYTVTETKRSGATRTQEFAESWDGCNLTRSFRLAGQTGWLTQEATYANGALAYSGEHYMYLAATTPLWVEGERYDDGSYWQYGEGRIRYTDIYEYRTGNADGYDSVWWERNYGDSAERGTDERFLDGSVRHTLDLDWEDCQAWTDITVTPDGNGSGASQVCTVGEDEWVVHVRCDVAITPGTCTEVCDDGVQRGCSWGWAIPTPSW